MKRIALTALVSGLAIAAATPASAAVIIGISTDGGATYATYNDGGTGSATFSGTVNGFTTQISALGVPVTTSPDLLTNTVNVRRSTTGTAGQIIIAITQTDVASFNGTLVSSLTSNSSSSPAALLQTLFSSTNAQFAGTQLQGATMSGNTGMTGYNTISGTFPFSLTTKYTFSYGVGAASYNDTINIEAAVPETATWGMMVLGFGLLGATLRRRSVGARIRFA